MQRVLIFCSALVASGLGFTLNVSAAAASAAVNDSQPQRPPNIVLLYIDDLGWKDVGFMGGDFYETPAIDELAAQSVVFTNAYANGPNCAPSRASLLNGQYTPRHGIYTVAPSARGKAKQRRIIPIETKTELPASYVCLAELLKKAGYATAHFGKWHQGKTDETGPTAQGFDVNIGGTGEGHPKRYFSPYKNAKLEDGPQGEYLTDRLTDEAVKFIRSHHEEPFFVYFSHYAVHSPIQAKEELTKHFKTKLAKLKESGQPLLHQHAEYAAMIASVDECVARVVKALKAAGVMENTVIIFTSDNGAVGGVSSQRPLRGAKGMLYEGGIRVPMFIHWPGKFKQPRRVETPVIGMDLFPTIVALGQAKIPADHPVDGLDLAPLLTEDAPLARDALFWHFPAYLQGRDPDSHDAGWRTTPAGAIRMGAWKLIEYFETGELELFNLETDLGERQNLAQQHPEQVERLHNRMQQWRQKLHAPVPSQPNPAYRAE